MASTTGRARRGLFGVFAVSAAGGAAVAALALPAGPGAPSATAAADPCAASEIAKTIGSVANSTAGYLDAHPETNTALTTISQQQAGPQSLGALKTYFDANPQVAKDMQALQAPLVGLGSRCKLPISPSQLMGLAQAAQSQGGGALAGTSPAALPGTASAAQNAGVPGTSGPLLQSPAAVARQGAGPLPGPAPTTAG